MIACVVASAALVFGGSVAASAAEPDPVIELTATQEADIRAWWTDAGVSTEAQDALVANLELGILPQSSTGAAPVETFTDTADGMARTISVYADGSRRIASQQIPVTAPPTGVTPLGNGITGCTTVSGWRVNCKVKIEDAVSGSSFIIDWYPATGGAKVRDMRAKTCWNSVGGCSYSGSIKRVTQSGTAPAWAEQSFQAWVGPIPAASGAFGLRALNTTATMYHPF